MESSALYGVLTGDVLLLALAMGRLAVAFIVLPIFSNELLPALVRNSVFVSLSLIVLVLHPVIDLSQFTALELISLFVAEALIGIFIGIFFGLFLWAFGAAGEVVDTAIGSSIGMIHDPISGNEVTLIGEFLGRLVHFLFMAAGGLLMICGAVLESYILWPIAQPLPELSMPSVELIEGQFESLMVLIFMIASPILVIIFLVDLCMGLVNRFAQQLNVLFLSISVKSVVALVVLLVLIPVLSSVFVRELNKHNEALFDLMRALFSG